MMTETNRGSSVGRWIGDLDHPFYDDERNRHVWYEGSTIGLQVVLGASLVVGGIAVLVGGADIVNWVLLMLSPAVLGALAAVSHAHGAGSIYVPTLWDIRRSRGLVGLAAMLFFAVALAIVGIREGNPMLIGAVAGVVVGGVAAAVVTRAETERADRKLDLLED